MPAIPQRRFVSPLRYPGGKGKISNFIKLLFIYNDLVGHSYSELYAGGASVALSLLYEEYTSHIHINDLNRSVYAFWNAVLNNTEELCRLIMDVDVTIEQWQYQKQVQADHSAEPLQLAFSTFFLNRTNRSGIIQGGVIGGKRQDGEWKLDARYNKTNLIQRIQKVARYRSRITLTHYDAANYIQNVLPSLPGRTFSYLDPPYYVKGEGLYEHFYQHSNHAEIARLIQNVTQPYIVSYDAADAILDLYKDYDNIAYGLNYSAAERYSGNEVMFFSPGLVHPSVESPANINNNVVRHAQSEGLLFAGQI